MCGIVGSLNFKHSSGKIDINLMKEMRDTMIHRGPDGAGIWVSSDEMVGMAHRRLSIIDLSEKASQPMLSADQATCLVFNGEIYNFSEIRDELLKTGNYEWRTDHSDTEVILHAYAEWGIDCIDKFRGMFAIAIWDSNLRCLWLIRDRLGEKPLYYSIFNEKFNFASEIKALLEDPDQEREVDPNSFYHYLSFLTTPAPNTLFKGIKKLPAGHLLKVDETGAIEERIYWDVLENTTPLNNTSESEISERIISELRKSVELRKVADVPVGVFLSGGIDSSTNLALFSEGDKNEVINSFSIGYKGKYQSYQNELNYAREMAIFSGANYHEMLLDEDTLIDFLPTLVHLQDEPIADPVCFPVYFVSKLAREYGVPVCQVGEGADELFCGYSQWQLFLNLYKWNKIPIPKLIKKLGLKALEIMQKKHTIYYEWLRRGVEDEQIFWGGAEAFTEFQKSELISNKFKEKITTKSTWEIIKPIREKFDRLSWDKSNLNWMTYLDLNIRLPELLLMRVDKMSMGVSLEARAPFLDHKFVELAMSIPTHIKLGDGNTKYILKKAVRGLIPDNIIDRKKQGFGVPVHEWLLGRLGKIVSKELNDFCDASGILNKNAVNKLIQSQSSAQIWYLFNFAVWWRINIARKNA